MSTIETISDTKVMLAHTYKDGMPLPFPVLASPKLDGVRCFIENGVALSRSGKPIRNETVQAFFDDGRYNGLDGELISGVHDETVFRRTTSIVMKASGSKDWAFHVFDDLSRVDIPFIERIRNVKAQLDAFRSMSALDRNHIKFVPQVEVDNDEQLAEYEAKCLEAGYEGVMIKLPLSLYEGKRTKSLLKVKRFSDAEGVIIGFEPLVRKTGVVEDGPNGMVGKLMLLHPDTGLTFGCGGGMTHEERLAFWQDRDNLVGKLAKYKFFDVGGYDVPRFPTFLGIRDADDL